MSEDRHIIWTNDLDYDDWKADLESEYPDLTENERYELMYEINGDYLDDERVNLNNSLYKKAKNFISDIHYEDLKKNSEFDWE